jgi:hypothetical protein
VAIVARSKWQSPEAVAMRGAFKQSVDEIVAAGVTWQQQQDGLKDLASPELVERIVQV